MILNRCCKTGDSVIWIEVGARAMARGTARKRPADLVFGLAERQGLSVLARHGWLYRVWRCGS